MNLELLAGAMLGHFVGDYLLQTQWMATRKTIEGWEGHKACTVHVLLYMLAVALFTGWYPLFLLAIGIPHWIIDRWSLGGVWLKWKNGYSLHKVWRQAPLCANPAPDELQQNVWKVAFAAPVYIFNDNTMHWVCIWFTVRWFFGA